MAFSVRPVLHSFAFYVKRGVPWELVELDFHNFTNFTWNLRCWALEREQTGVRFRRSWFEVIFREMFVSAASILVCWLVKFHVSKLVVLVNFLVLSLPFWHFFTFRPLELVEFRINLWYLKRAREDFKCYVWFANNQNLLSEIVIFQVFLIWFGQDWELNESVFQKAVILQVFLHFNLA